MIEYIDIDIYLNCVVIAAGIDENDFDVLYNDHKDKFSEEEYKNIRRDIADPNSCNGLTVRLDCGNVFVYIRKGSERKELYVTHELYHATHRILQRAGVEHGDDGESYAYLLGWLVNEYFNRLDDYEVKQTQKKSKKKQKT